MDAEKVNRAKTAMRRAVMRMQKSAPGMLQVYLDCKVMPTDDPKVSTRAGVTGGNPIIEYNPDFVGYLEPSMLAATIYMECLRISLHHCDRRRQEPVELLKLASDIVVAEYAKKLVDTDIRENVEIINRLFPSYWNYLPILQKHGFQPETDLVLEKLFKIFKEEFENKAKQPDEPDPDNKEEKESKATKEQGDKGEKAEKQEKSEQQKSGKEGSGNEEGGQGKQEAGSQGKQDSGQQGDSEDTGNGNNGNKDQGGQGKGQEDEGSDGDSGKGDSDGDGKSESGEGDGEKESSGSEGENQGKQSGDGQKPKDGSSGGNDPGKKQDQQDGGQPDGKPNDDAGGDKSQGQGGDGASGEGADGGSQAGNNPGDDAPGDSSEGGDNSEGGSDGANSNSGSPIDENFPGSAIPENAPPQSNFDRMAKYFSLRNAESDLKNWEQDDVARDRTTSTVNDAIDKGMFSRMRGNLPLVLRNANRVKVDKEAMFRKFMASHVDDEAEATWSRRNRKYLRYGMIAPGYRYKEAQHILCCVDVSGSMYQGDTLLKCLTVMENTVDGLMIDLVYWDAVCSPVFSAPKSIKDMAIYGGGLTNPECVLRKLGPERYKYDGLVFLTDCKFEWDEPAKPKQIMILRTHGNAPFPKWCYYADELDNFIGD